MHYLQIATAVAGLSLLAACGDGTPFANRETVPVGTVEVTTDAYTVVQGDRTITLDRADSFDNFEQRVWRTGPDGAVAYESDSVAAIGGVQADETPFAGITGVVRDAPVSDATFEGGFGVFTAVNEYTPGALTLNYDLATGALTNDGGPLTVDATATEIGISGTVSYAGEDANMLGNFYGTDEVAAAFTGDRIGGVLYGTQQ